MKKLFLIVLPIVVMLGLIGCSSNKINPLDKEVAVPTGYLNHYNTPYYEISTSEDIEDVVAYLPKDTTTVRLKMKVSNLEDVIYMKLITEDGYEIDKILRRVEDMKMLGYEQDGYMYEPSVEKNVVTLQIYVPSIYIYNGAFKPKLIFSFKRNARSIQESINFYFLRDIYTVSKVVIPSINTEEKNATIEQPAYMTLSDFCASSRKADDDFFTQIVKVNENRIDIETIKDIENSCK